MSRIVSSAASFVSAHYAPSSLDLTFSLKKRHAFRHSAISTQLKQSSVPLPRSVVYAGGGGAKGFNPLNMMTWHLRGKVNSHGKLKKGLHPTSQVSCLQKFHLTPIHFEPPPPNKLYTTLLPRATNPMTCKPYTMLQSDGGVLEFPIKSQISGNTSSWWMKIVHTYLENDISVGRSTTYRADL